MPTRGRHRHRCQVGGRHAALSPQHRHGVPELRAVSPSHGCREYRLPAEAARRRPRRSAPGWSARRSSWCICRATASAIRASSPAASSSAWRWPAPSSSAAASADGRAAGRARQAAAREPAARDAPPACRSRHHLHLRHARPGRSAHHVRPHRRHERRQGGAGRRPEDLYDRPTSRFVAGFIGESNFLPAIVRGLEDDVVVAECDGAIIRAVSPHPAGRGREGDADDAARAPALRRQRLELDHVAQNRLSVTVTEAVFAGERCRYMLQAGDGTAMVLKEPSSAAIRRRAGRRAGGDRLVGRGHDPCLRSALSGAVVRALGLVASRPLRASFSWQRAMPIAAGRAAGRLHAGLLRPAGGDDADAQRVRSGVDAVELRRPAGRRGVPEDLLQHLLHLADRHAGNAAHGLSGGARAGARAALGAAHPDPDPAALLDQRSGAQLRLDGADGPARADQRGPAGRRAARAAACASSTRRSPRRSR